MHRKLISVIAALGILFGAAACSSPSATPETLPADAVIIDVRTAEEYNEGHLEGAELLDLNSGEFAQAVPSLDPNADYVVYCRSGNRSGQAAQLLKEAGFENVVDLGAVEAASKSSGIPIVTD